MTQSSFFSTHPSDLTIYRSQFIQMFARVKTMIMYMNHDNKYGFY